MPHQKKLIDAVLQKTPHEPLPGSPLRIVTNRLLTAVELERLEEVKKGASPPYWDGYVQLQTSVQNELSQVQKNTLDVYLGITAFEIARHQLEFSPEAVKKYKWIYAVHAINILAKNLAIDTGDSLVHVEEKTAEFLQEKRLLDSVLGQKEEKKDDGLRDDPDLEHSLVIEIVEDAKKHLQNSGGGSAIRYLMGVYNKIVTACKAKGVRPHLHNLTLGDVTGKNMPPAVVDALGYDPLSSKGIAIGRRAKAYETMLYENEVEFDPHRYDLAALGWEGLRDQFIEYGQQFGLYSSVHEVKESLIGEGGAGTLLRVFTAIHMHLKKELPGKPFSVYFPNPAFRMVGDAAADAGLTVIEMATKQENGFFPDPQEVDTYLTAHPKCKVFIFIPIGNPNANFPLKTTVEALLTVLQKHGTILVNDFAYLGTGDQQKNKELARVLSSYKKRIDSYSMSKIFGRTGLRCGCAITTDEELAQQFSPAAKHIQLGLSYPTQQEALAIWDYVSQSDRTILNEYYSTQQKNLLQKLRKNDEIRIKNGKKPLLDSQKPIFGEAGLYLYVPLTEGYSSFDVLEETGYVGVPDSAFSNPALSVEGPYMRFALGVERI